MSLVIICPERDPEIWVNVLQQLDPKIEIERYPEEKDLSKIEYAIAWRHPYGVFSRYPNLRCISSMGAGVDHLLGDPDLPATIPVVRLVDERLASDMFEYVLALILAHIRNLRLHFNDQARASWGVHDYQRIENTRIGILGLGAIGSHVASQLTSLGFRVSGWSKTAKQGLPHASYFGESQLSAFLSATDILVCLLPLTQETSGILNADLFYALPKGAYLINAGRGEQLVETDLLKALDDKQLSGAALDVFATEPLPATHAFWNHPLIVITPHIASVTDPNSCAPQILENYNRMKKNLPLLNLVSREKGY